MIASWHAVFLYSLQLYFDFSGYSDMAIGLARMFNVRFPLNFNSPYKATGIIDYWQRFHMTLTRYITLYVFNPMAVAITRRPRGAREGLLAQGDSDAGRLHKPAAAANDGHDGVAGIWHGSGLQYLAFGLLHGAYFAVNHAWRIFGGKICASGRSDSACRVYCAHLPLCVCCFRVLPVAVARCCSRDDWGMLGLHGGLGTACEAVEATQTIREAAWLAVLYVIVWLMPNTQQIMSFVRARLSGASRLGRCRGSAGVLSLPCALAFGFGALVGLHEPSVARANSSISSFDVRVSTVPLSAQEYAMASAAAMAAGLAFSGPGLALAPLAFLDQEYPSFLAKRIMLETCDLGSVLVIGDSRAAADIVASRLPTPTANLAVGGGGPVEGYFLLRRAMQCPRPPTRVILSFNAQHLSHVDTFWERSVRFRAA